MNALVPLMRLKDAVLGSLMGFGFETVLVYGLLIRMPDFLPYMICCLLPFVFIISVFQSIHKYVVIGLFGNLMLALLIFNCPKADFNWFHWYSAIIASTSGIVAACVTPRLIWPIAPREELKYIVIRIFM